MTALCDTVTIKYGLTPGLPEKIPQALFDKPDVRPYFIVTVSQSAVKIKMR